MTSQPSNKKAWLVSLFLLIVFTVLAQKLFAQQNTGTAPSGGARFYGDAALLSDWREHGVTQTNKNYALQTGFGYQWPVLKLGLWGSNVSYGTSENLNLRPHLQFQVNMTQNLAFGFKYVLNQYYSSTNKNGTILGFNLVYSGYNITYEQKTNWNAYGDMTSYGLEKEFPFVWGLLFNLQTHYNLINTNSKSNFFDVMPEVKYKMADAFAVLGLSYNSSASQFDGQADMVFYIGLRAKF
jgi:uncharacterized protein (TIGR02001 family)